MLDTKEEETHEEKQQIELLIAGKVYVAKYPARFTIEAKEDISREMKVTRTYRVL